MEIGFISENMFSKIVAELLPSTIIVPFFRGESTLHPKFPDFMQELGTFKEVQLATNGDYLTHANQKAILENCTFFSLSLHEESLPTQKQTEFLFKLRKAGITTQVSTVGKPKNLDALYGLADRIRIYEPHSINHIADMMHAQTVTSCCHKPFSDMVVYWNGKVGLCNHDWNNSFPLGDLNHKSIAEVWNGRAYQTVREFHKKGQRRQVDVCRHCSFENGKIYGELIQ